jgi:hypothetical protein
MRISAAGTNTVFFMSAVPQWIPMATTQSLMDNRRLSAKSEPWPLRTGLIGLSVHRAQASASGKESGFINQQVSSV